VQVGDLVQFRNLSDFEPDGDVGIVVSELRHGVNSSFVDVLVNGKVSPVNWKALKVIRESR
jgi:hypothetical protein